MTDENTALFLIDVQQSFLHTPYWSEELFPVFKQNLNKLISVGREKKWHVVHIFHNSNGPFDAANGFVRSMDFVDQHGSDPVFNKHVHNAITESGLDLWLRENRIENIVISGIRTEQCCETSCRVASDLGYSCEFVSDATLTFDMTHAITGELVKAKDIKNRTELVLSDRFAKITSVNDYG